MKYRSWLLILGMTGMFAGCSGMKKGQTKPAAAQAVSERLQLRDPFVFYDRKTDWYYTYANNKHGIKAWRSKDLQHWEALGNVFTASENFWGKQDFWAPDCYFYKGKYYLFVTFSGTDKMRGTSVLVSDDPDKGFVPLVNAPVTPKHWMCLDASLYIDKAQKPWLLFSREWLEVSDGEMYAQQLSSDLKTTIGAPQLLFKASAAPWTKAIYAKEWNKEGVITDAPFIYRMKNGRLALLWSSFDKSGKYAMGVAYAASGNITGPWVQSATTLNADDGGHGMLFHTREGKLKISYHSPNHRGARLTIRDVVVRKGRIVLE
ncbi:glycoside hydrolase family 43 protein [Niabella sp.]|uniref:glycoside hydrolase family 43 protein n=1 Tax=Niabella sp. TaxID=1962976 RepID=UPI00262DCA12|nr:glycoside hydrolase family 43 protein [Niabella sp.]